MNGDEQGIDLPRLSITTFYRVIKVFLHYLDSGSNLGARTPLFQNALVEFDKHSLTNGLVCKRPVKSFSRKLSSPSVRIGARADMKAGRNAMRRPHAMQTAPRESPALFKWMKKI